MRREGGRPEHLGWIEIALRVANPDLLHLALAGQSHYGPSNRVAFVDVFGVDGGRTRRCKIRAETNAMLRPLGDTVELVPEREVFDNLPERPGSAHEELELLQRLGTAIDQSGVG